MEAQNYSVTRRPMLNIQSLERTTLLLRLDRFRTVSILERQARKNENTFQSFTKKRKKDFIFRVLQYSTA